MHNSVSPDHDKAPGTASPVDTRQVGELLHDIANTLAVVTTNLDVALARLPPVAGIEPVRTALLRAAMAIEVRAAINQFVAAALAQRATPQAPQFAAPAPIATAVATAADLLRRVVEPGFTVTTASASDACTAIDSDALSGLLVAVATELRRDYPECSTLRLAAHDRPEPAAVQIAIEVRASGASPAGDIGSTQPSRLAIEPGRYTGLARALIQSAGGTLHIDRHPDGATLTVDLPRTEAKTSAVRPAEMTPPVELGDGQTLLVVDYDETRLEATHALLEGLGYAVHSAAGGAQATEAILSGMTYDALIAPFLLPEGTPGETLADIGRAQNPGMAAVLWRTHDDAAFRGAGAGADLHMVDLPGTRRRWSEMLCSALQSRANGGANPHQASRFTSPTNT